MVEISLAEKQKNSYLASGNGVYLETLYENYLADRASVPLYWQAYFDTIAQNGVDVSHRNACQWALDRIAQKQSHAGTVTDAVSPKTSTIKQQMAAGQLIGAYRRWGYLAAEVNPLMPTRPPVDRLQPHYYGLTAHDLMQTVCHDVSDLGDVPLQTVIDYLKARYANRIGVEYGHLASQDEIQWLREHFESKTGFLQISPTEKQEILQLLTAAEGMESYLARRYVGQKRFSLEGTDSLIPLLHRLIHRGKVMGAEEALIGMAHRGRLNVMLNIVGCPPSELIAEFEGTKNYGMTSGDVKYHNGYSADVMTESGEIHISLAFNPSHLEAIFPVALGSVRARLDQLYQQDHSKVLPIVLHGDASLSGQGVVMETFNMSQTRAHKVGGTIHIVVNNQVGFTTSDTEDARSSYYSTDIAKLIDIPVFRASVDDPEALWWIASLALDYRATFGKDVIIDLLGYRRLGHNEADEPSLTQPCMYQFIRQHPTPRAIYAKKLEHAGDCQAGEADALLESYQEKMQSTKSLIPLAKKTVLRYRKLRWKHYIENVDNHQALVDTGYDKQALIALGKKITTVPKTFKLHRIIKKMVENRQAILKGDVPVDWGCAETLAYATLVARGIPVRLVGEDVERGTFAHRHAVWHDQNTGACYTPLTQISERQASFQVYNSLLSEFAAMGFEYGYASFDPKPLVLWEAQFGDFANGAQVIIDQFISSAWQKWQRLCGLILLLPHGYEAMGPEHSSARLERYLQLSAQNNIQVCMPSMPAQMFHLIRRQALSSFRRPLIVMTPKSFLRHKEAISSIDQLASGKFYQVIKEQDPAIKHKRVKRIILCSGKIYYELVQARRAHHIDWIACVRVEQLYPFPTQDLKAILRTYPSAKEIVWCQEEPKNQGAWYSIVHAIMELVQSDCQSLHYAGRNASAAPSPGYVQLHRNEQQALIAKALDLKT